MKSEGKTSRPWTRAELILAISLYCKTPFGRMHMRNPDIIALAEEIDRTPGAVSYKLANLASIDESIHQKGAANASRLDREVWIEFFEHPNIMALVNEAYFTAINTPITAVTPSIDDLVRPGLTKNSVVKIRTNQDFFRRMILTSYNSACCITGIGSTELLNASHIIPWAHNTKTRMNPTNGLCLNALHDRAFDRGLLSIDDAYKVIIADKVKHPLLRQYHGQPIHLPKRFIPDQRFLSYHREHIFIDR